MDEGMLNDLLECSVCFERLDTSSKVLPCQHTFCKKCLESIYNKRKELRCPECRTVVPCKIDNLPPNVLLMRILEGMKNSVPKKQHQRTARNVNSSVPAAHHVPPQADQHRHTPTKQPNPVSAATTTTQALHHQQQLYAKALYDYNSTEPGDLSFKRGNMIVLTQRIDTNWCEGECGGNRGVFPLSYIQVITPVPSNVPQCKALYDFRMRNDDEEGCLTFKKNDIITVIRRVDDNWAEGKLDDRIGIFPLAFVELNNLARSLMKLSTNSQPGPSKLAPPTPTSDDSTPRIRSGNPFILPQPTDDTDGLYVHYLDDSRTSFVISTSKTLVPNKKSGGTSSATTQAANTSTQAFVEQLYKNNLDGSGSGLIVGSYIARPVKSSGGTSSSTTQAANTSSQFDDDELCVHYPDDSRSGFIVCSPKDPLPIKKSGGTSSVTTQAANTSNQATGEQLHNHNVDESGSSFIISSSSTPPFTSSGGTSSGSSTAPSSPSSPPTKNTANAGAPRIAPKPDIVPNVSAISTPQRPTNSATVAPPTPQQLDAHSSHHHHREKRHSFTSLSTSHHNSSSHRHSAEILSPENASAAETQSNQAKAAISQKQATAISPLVNLSNPNGVQLPQAYVALYPYKPQKADELELRKGGIYIVTERCQDGWFKGTSNRTQKCGVFPGNYVTLARGAPRSPQPASRTSGGSSGGGGEGSSDSKSVVSYIRKTRHSANGLPPDLPPRSASPATATNTISSSWHGQQDSAAVPLGRSSSAIMSSVANSPHLSTATNCATVGKSIEKHKERKEKGSVSLMRRLTSIKRSKSPPATSTFSMDNPVFEDSSVAINTSHPVHVRSGSCPSQLLQQAQPSEHHRIFVSTSQRLKHKDRPSVFAHNPRSPENLAGGSSSTTTGSTTASSAVPQNPHGHHHRKSNSLDASGNRASKHGYQTVRERFRCIAPYPANSEYELELQVDDIIYVHKKRDDGWYKGTQQRTGRTGLIPASFVEGF